MIQSILSKIAEGQRFLVTSHEGPDGDAIGSTLAFALLLREMGKDVVAFNGDGVPQDFAFLPGAETLVRELGDESGFDTGFVLDAGELKRAGNDLGERCKSLVNIDHHPYSESFGEINFVDEEASATGVLIYRIAKAAGHPISEAVALCIYTAILSDTGSFRYSNSNPEAFRVAAEMVEVGVDPWTVASGLYESQDEKRLNLLARALSTLTLSSCRRYASVSVTLGMMEEVGAGAEFTDGFVNYPRSIRGVEVALFFRQIESDAYKIGFRSKGRINVGSLAHDLGGGGHHNAAGAVVRGSLEDVRNTVFSRLLVLLD